MLWVRWVVVRVGRFGAVFSVLGIGVDVDGDGDVDDGVCDCGWNVVVGRSGDVVAVWRGGLISGCLPADFVRFDTERVGIGMMGVLSCLYSSAVVSFLASSESSRMTSSQLFVLCTGGPRSFKSPRSGLLRRGEIEEEMRDFRPREGGLSNVVERESTGRRHGTL